MTERSFMFCNNCRTKIVGVYKNRAGHVVCHECNKKLEAGEQPNPGSIMAQEKGCTCAVMDNAYGAGSGYGKDTFWITGDCPLHGKKEEKKDVNSNQHRPCPNQS